MAEGRVSSVDATRIVMMNIAIETSLDSVLPSARLGFTLAIGDCQSDKTTPSVWEKSCVLFFFGWIKACGNFYEMVQVYRKC